MTIKFMVGVWVSAGITSTLQVKCLSKDDMNGCKWFPKLAMISILKCLVSMRSTFWGHRMSLALYSKHKVGAYLILTNQLLIHI